MKSVPCLGVVGDSIVLRMFRTNGIKNSNTLKTKTQVLLVSFISKWMNIVSLKRNNH